MKEVIKTLVILVLFFACIITTKSTLNLEHNHFPLLKKDQIDD
jgi:hypothetical protein